MLFGITISAAPGCVKRATLRAICPALCTELLMEETELYGHGFFSPFAPPSGGS